MLSFWRNEWIKMHLSGGTHVTNWPCWSLSCWDSVCLLHKPVRACCIKTRSTCIHSETGWREPLTMENAEQLRDEQRAGGSNHCQYMACRIPTSSLTQKGGSVTAPTASASNCLKLNRELWTKCYHKFKMDSSIFAQLTLHILELRELSRYSTMSRKT